MAKIEYTKLFEIFWEAYPRKTAKQTAFKAWQKNVDEDDAFMPKAMVADLEKRTRMKWWPFDKTKIPHAATWINSGRYLDEGWEDDIKTRGQEQRGATYSPLPVHIESPTHDKGAWMNMLNRLMVSYLLRAGGFPDAMLNALVKEKNKVHAEILPAANEEIDSAQDKAAAKYEMAVLFATTMLSRFDALTGRSLKDQVIKLDGVTA